MTDKICERCKKIAETNAVALCEKILSFEKTYCLDCLAKELDCSRECVDGIIRSYKEKGCPAFA